MKNFGEFYNDQIENASCIVLSHTTYIDESKIENCIELIKGKNPAATLVTTPWEDLDGIKILEAMEGSCSLKSELKHLKESEVCPECGEHHHDEHCCCDHEHHHDEHCDCNHDHHHHDEHCNHDHHHHDEHCNCDHEHHHADDVFASWGTETTHKYSDAEIKKILEELENEQVYGMVLRAKGIVSADNGQWIHFDYVPGEADVRLGAAEVIGRICVIGSNLNTESIEKLFSTDEKM